MKKQEIYLDAASNTPLDRKVFLSMKPFLKKSFVGNSHSIHHFGIKASNAVENSRKNIGNIVGVPSESVFFTSGATESNNWVLKSLALHELFEEKDPKKHIVVSAIEHASILKCCQQLETMGFTVTYVQPNAKGVITRKAVKSALRFDTLIVCVMAVNNETGVKNPVNLIGQLAHKNKSLMMSDCTQLLSYGDGYCCLRKIMPTVDYFTFSGHKIYGPTGTGCLITRPGAPLYPFIIGGAQEEGLRGGTSNTAGIVGLGQAFVNIAREQHKEFYEELYKYLLQQLNKNKIPFKLNCEPSHKNIVNLNFSEFMDDSELASLLSIYGVACSAGSACEANNEQAPSHVLTALGIPVREIANSVRISFSKYTTKKDMDHFVQIMAMLFQKSKEESHE